MSPKAISLYAFGNGSRKNDGRICMPKDEQFPLLQIYHDSVLQGGHVGETAMINKLLPLYC